MTYGQDLLALIRTARHIVALTGAGISAESGILTFRQAQTGLWAQYNPQELATPRAFLQNPRLVWEWYSWRRQLISQAEPNPGHFALAQLEELTLSRGAGFTLITQNVDGFHQRAGNRSPIELHGNILRTKCFDEGTAIESWQENGQLPPHCPRCGGLLRPDVVWFGEELPKDALISAWKATKTCDLFFSIGTSSLVEPAASLPYVATQYGAQVVEINPNETPLSPVAHHILRGPSGTVLPELLLAAFGNQTAES